MTRGGLQFIFQRKKEVFRPWNCLRLSSRIIGVMLKPQLYLLCKLTRNKRAVRSFGHGLPFLDKDFFVLSIFMICRQRKSWSCHVFLLGQLACFRSCGLTSSQLTEVDSVFYSVMQSALSFAYFSSGSRLDARWTGF